MVAVFCFAWSYCHQIQNYLVFFSKSYYFLVKTFVMFTVLHCEKMEIYRDL